MRIILSLVFVISTFFTWFLLHKRVPLDSCKFDSYVGEIKNATYLLVKCDGEVVNSYVHK